MECFEHKGDTVIFTGTKLEVYVSEKIFRTASVDGDTVKFLGICNFRYTMKGDEITGKEHLFTLNFPSLIETKPIRRVEKDLKLKPDGKLTKYVIMTYEKGSEFISNTNIVKDISNVEIFSNGMIGGAIINTIPYDELMNVPLMNLEINGMKIGTSEITIGIIMSELARNAGNIAEPFRKEYGRSGKKQGYMMSNSRDVAASNSTFSAITFEDPMMMFATSINRTRKNIKENISPLEKMIQL